MLSPTLIPALDATYAALERKTMTPDPSLTTVSIHIDDTCGEMTLRCGSDGDGMHKDFPTFNCEELTLKFRDQHELAEQIKSWVLQHKGWPNIASLSYNIEKSCEAIFTDAIEKARGG